MQSLLLDELEPAHLEGLRVLVHVDRRRAASRLQPAEEPEQEEHEDGVALTRVDMRWDVLDPGHELDRPGADRAAEVDARRVLRSLRGDRLPKRLAEHGVPA